MLRLAIIDPAGAGNIELSDTLAQGGLPVFGVGAYCDIKAAVDRIYYEPDLVILHNASEADILGARGIKSWRGKLICVVENEASVHHIHREEMHVCDRSNLCSVALEVLDSKSIAS